MFYLWRECLIMPVLNDVNKCAINTSFSLNDAWLMTENICLTMPFTFVPDDNFEQALIDQDMMTFLVIRSYSNINNLKNFI